MTALDAKSVSAAHAENVLLILSVLLAKCAGTPTLVAIYAEVVFSILNVVMAKCAELGRLTNVLAVATIVPLTMTVLAQLVLMALASNLLVVKVTRFVIMASVVVVYVNVLQARSSSIINVEC